MFYKKKWEILYSPESWLKYSYITPNNKPQATKNSFQVRHENTPATDWGRQQNYIFENFIFDKKNVVVPGSVRPPGSVIQETPDPVEEESSSDPKH